MLASGVALAKNIQGDGKDNRLVGTNRADTISGSGGNDLISGLGGADRLHGDSGADEARGGGGGDEIYGDDGDDDLFGQSGNDELNAADLRFGETVNCGSGNNDSAIIDVDINNDNADDVNLNNCENIFIAIGPFSVNSADSADVREITPEERQQLEEILQ